MGQASSPNNTKCAHCPEAAAFVTPVGQVCADHVLDVTLAQGRDSEDRWLPTPLVK